MIATPHSPRRAWLFTPGDQPQKIEKIRQLEVDCVIFDWEDAVAVSRKEAARHIVAAAQAAHDFGVTECFVRINAAATSFFADDLAAATQLDIAGLILPKVETAAHLCHAHELLGDSAMPLLAIIETALGIMNLKEIAQATSRLAGLMFGAEDLTADLGAMPSPDKRELFYARSAVVTAAAAYGLAAIDTVYTDIRDLTGLERETRLARQMGYGGKMALHPQQVDVIQTVFAPTAAEIARAQEIVMAYEAHIAAGEAVFVIDGRMVDKPIIRAAQQVLARARLSAGG